MKLKKIKRCPFCGRKATDSFNGGDRFVICDNCGATGQQFNVCDYQDLNNLEIVNLAIDSWNKRVK
jgi:hypothetical protein